MCIVERAFGQLGTGLDWDRRRAVYHDWIDSLSDTLADVSSLLYVRVAYALVIKENNDGER